MSSVTEVLVEHDLAVPENRLAAELRVLLRRDAVNRDDAETLTATEAALLHEHGGLRPVSTRRLADLDARSAALVVRTAADALSRTQVAQRLGIAVSRVSHRTRDGLLYAYPGASGRPRFPSWQFTGDTVLPHLDGVLRALPDAAHPAVVATFMTTPLDSLRLGSRLVSPCEWLRAGGAPAAITAAAVTLGEQI